jgi:hypothetical protein
MKNYIALALIALTITTAHAQDPAHATEFRKPTPGPGPNGASNPTFLVHRLGNDHAEGIATPGSYDPNVIYAYKINRDATFTRIPLSYNGTAGVGTQIIAEDLDKDGDIDIAVAGKLGVHFLENLKINKVPKETREAEQPLERKWPFPNEGQEVPQEDGPK